MASPPARPAPETQSGCAAPGRDLDAILEAVWADAEQHGFAGWDPYDGLNSRLFRATPFFRIGKARQAWIQVVKRSPLNLRPLFAQSPEVLAKGVSLFALGAFALSRAGGAGARRWEERGRDLLARLDLLKSPGFTESCWGYPYDWQSRAFFQPRNAPNLICSVFAALAHERRDDGGDALAVSREVAAFIERHLWREAEGEAWITYTPTTDTRVHNVNMLGAALLARVGAGAPEGDRTGGSGDRGAPAAAAPLRERARRAMEFSVARLSPQGAWPYGEAPNQGWVDNFHTGYNLVALEDYRRTTGETWVDEPLERAYRYWDTRFFRRGGAPSYYDTGHWPLDIHCPAQAILTWLALERLDPEAPEKARRMAEWTLGHLWDGRRHFTFQKGRFLANRIPMIRWGQGWMFRALAELRGRG